MSVPIIPALLRQSLADLAADDQRLDGRDKFTGRDIEIEIDCFPGHPYAGVEGLYLAFGEFSWSTKSKS